MAKKLNSVLGVDIGSQKMKIAEVRLQGKDAVVTALAMGDTPEGAVDHTGIYDSDAIGAALKDLAAAAGVTAADAVVTVHGQASVLVRTVEVPRMNPNELKDHMQWEISRNIPFAESTVVSDFAAFPPEDAASQNMDVVLAISPQSAVDTLVALGKKAGKKLAAIDVEPLSIARVIKSNYADDYAGKSVCVVDVGHKTTNINIYRDGKLLMPRTVPLGGEQFTRAIAESMGVEAGQAEETKIANLRIPDSAATGTMGGGVSATETFTPYNPFADPMDFNPALAPPEVAGLQPEMPSQSEVEPEVPAAIAPAAPSDAEGIRIFNATAPVLEEFVAEIRRSIDYFRSKGGDVDAILLSGGGSMTPGLKEFVAKAVGISTELCDPFKGIQVNAKKLDPKILNSQRQEFAIAVGNGLHIAY